METMKERCDIEAKKYQQIFIADSKEKYYKKLSDKITNFNDNNNTQLSNKEITEAVLRVMKEDEEGEITDANNITAYRFSHMSSSQIEISIVKR